MENLTLKNRLGQFSAILNSKSAALKMFFLSYGLDFNYKSFIEKYSGFPLKFKTKARKTVTKIVDGQLINADESDDAVLPSEIFIHFENSKSIVKFNYNADSPFILDLCDGKPCIREKNGNLTFNAELAEKFFDSQNLSDGTKLSEVISILGSDRIALLLYEGCSGWFFNKQCRFCDSCTQKPNKISVIPTLNKLSKKYKWNYDLWIEEIRKKYFPRFIEAYEKIIISQEILPHKHFHFMAGNIPDVNLEWRLSLELSRKLNEKFSLAKLDSYINLLPPKDIKFIEEAKEIGYQNILFSPEVYGEEYFKAICPEKSELIPYRQFHEMIKKSVDIFGIGKVRCNFVLGAQPISILKEGVEKLAKDGVASDFTIFTPKRGTPWENKPRVEAIKVVEFTKFLFDTYQKYGFKGIYCTESSRSCVLNEMLNGK